MQILYILRTIAMYVYMFGYMLLFYGTLRRGEKAKAAGDLETVRQIVNDQIPRWCRGLLKVSGVRMTVEGTQNIPASGPVVFVGNHRSYFDIPIMLVALDHPHGILAKEELAHIPLLSRWMNLLGCVYVKRDDIRGSLQALKDAAQVVKAGESFTIFPEGTRTSRQREFRLRRGAAALAVHSGRPLQVITITLSTEFLSKEKRWYHVPKTCPEYVLSVGEQLTPAYLEGFNRTHPDANCVYYQSWGARLGKNNADAAMRVTHDLFYPAHGDSDGLVTPQSARWGRYRGTLEGVSHQQLVDAQGKDDNCFDVRQFYIQLVQELVQMGF